MRSVRACFPLAVLLVLGCREKPRLAPEPPKEADVEVTDSGADTLAAAVEELLDSASDAPPLRGDVTIDALKIEPKGAYAKLDLADQRWRFLRCYEAPGTVKLQVRVGEGGEPITATGPTCVAEAAKLLVFPEPAGGFASVELTLRFTSK